MRVTEQALEPGDQVAIGDAVLLYRFNPKNGEHIFRLVDPVADRKHMKVHRAND